jgi:hypothetical protein
MSAFCVKVAEPAAGFVEQWRLGLTQASLNGGGRWWWVKIQDLESLGRDSSRWVTVDGFILTLGTGVYFDFSQSHRVMGLSLDLSARCPRWRRLSAMEILDRVGKHKTYGADCNFYFLGSFV